MFEKLASETGTIRKKWTNRVPVALLYPNAYSVAVSNLGFQIVYHLLNRMDNVVCERFVYPDGGEPMRSLESGRSLQDFPLVCGSVSFEEDFPRLVGMLAAGGIEPFAEKRGNSIRKGEPLVILGGVAVFMNPEPLAPFADLMVIGEGEAVLPGLFNLLIDRQESERTTFLHDAAVSVPGCYVPGLYTPEYDEQGRVVKVQVHPGAPARVAKAVIAHQEVAGRSMLLSPEAELGMYMVELGRGCSRGCRFCAAGYIYRPPRLWPKESVLAALNERPDFMDRIGLLGMEMASGETLDGVARYLQENGCSLSFSSLRADHISDQLLSLLSASGLKSVAVAPDGASERLRRVINKGLSEADLLSAAVRLVEAGIFHLKLYVMIGLPTETEQDLDELIQLVQELQSRINAVGRKRGRLTEITLSINSFVPKPWTPFQYCSYGGLSAEQAGGARNRKQSVMALKGKIKYLRKALGSTPNLRIKVDRPERVLQQAVYSRADRRIAPVLLDVGTGRLSFQQAMKAHKLSCWEYAVRPREKEELLCWEIIDHGLTSGYLWKEYEKSMAGKGTPPCKTDTCRRCGICG